MKVKIYKVEPDTSGIEPSLNVLVEVIYYKKIESLLSIGGTLCSHDNKTLGTFTEHESNTFQDSLTFASENWLKKIKTESPFSIVHRLNVNLTKAGVEYIENLRLNNGEKKVVFNINLLVRFMQINNEAAKVLQTTSLNQPFCEVFSEKLQLQHTINQSDWVQVYTQPLGIGNFFLIEINSPEPISVLKHWKEIHKRLSDKCFEAESFIRKGEWKHCMQSIRGFYEVLTNEVLRKETQKKELETIFINDTQVTADSYIHFINSFNNLYQYISNFTHDTDKKGNLKPLALANKEDAYFAYTLSLSILNILGKKLRP